MKTNNKVLRGLIAGMCAGMSGAVFGADVDGTDKLREVVVTATKTAKDTMDAPATVSVVTAKDIENANIHSVDEALTLLPGVYTSRPGGHEPSVMGTNVVMRGIPDYSRTLVLVDGQTLNDPYIGAVTWESVPPETVARIEVVPGPFSSLYGGSAMGGVINIITKTPTKREFSVKGGYGTDNFKSGSLVYQDRVGERVGIVFNYAYKESDGYIKDEVVLKPGGVGGTVVTGGQLTTDAYGNTAYLVGDKGENGWSSQNLGVKLYVDLPADSRLSLGASQFLYDSSGRNQYNTYLRDASG
ncbi:MAG: TonB-dependent receptor plug domain-containing protein, partial [Thiobacillus sp.]|nr:TonB-dependent receptor plug domain-containing protein [Thiobacillus sp.]